jgi:hypothetical protein
MPTSRMAALAARSPRADAMGEVGYQIMEFRR